MELKTVRDGNRVIATRWLPDSPPSAYHKLMGQFPNGATVDRWQEVTFSPPCFLKIDSGSMLSGTGAREGKRTEGSSRVSLNAFTPETETSTHYYFVNCYDAKLAKDITPDVVLGQIRVPLIEDIEMVELIEANIPVAKSRAINLAQDIGGLSARRIVTRILAEEQGHPSETPPDADAETETAS